MKTFTSKKQLNVIFVSDKEKIYLLYKVPYIIY